MVETALVMLMVSLSGVHLLIILDKVVILGYPDLLVLLQLMFPILHMELLVNIHEIVLVRGRG